MAAPASSTFVFSQTSVNVLINRDDMGEYRSTADQVVQSLPGAVSDGLGAFATPVYFNQTVYYSGSRDSVKAFSLETGVFNPSPTAVSQPVFGYLGAGLAISANSDGQNAIVGP